MKSSQKLLFMKVSFALNPRMRSRDSAKLCPTLSPSVEFFDPMKGRSTLLGAQPFPIHLVLVSCATVQCTGAKSNRLGSTQRARLSSSERVGATAEAAALAPIPIEWVTLYGQKISISVVIFLVR